MTWETISGGCAGRLRIQGTAFRYERGDGGGEAGNVAEGEFHLEPLEAGTFTVLISGRSYRVAPGAPGQWVVNGTPVAMEIFDPRDLRERRAGGAQQGRHNISASMPGKVVRLLVAAGDAVEAGQGLVVVEAMKMQNEMKSPQAGRVAEVRTRPDAAVAAGEVLVVIE